MNDDEWNRKAAEARALAKTPAARAWVEVALKLGEYARGLARKSGAVLDAPSGGEPTVARVEAVNVATGGQLSSLDVPDAIERVMVATGWGRGVAIAMLTQWYAARREQLVAERLAREEARSPQPVSVPRPEAVAAMREMERAVFKPASVHYKCGPLCRCGIDRACPGWSKVN